MIATPDHDACQQAAQVLHNGGLVAFPTETVYGLGADARNVTAVKRIFDVKGRPTAHPLIVHIASAADLPTWAATIPAMAQQLAERFWPGPLTLILKKHATVPLDVTGGQGSIGLRVPAHPLALRLLTEFGGGIAAPSANRFGRVSPTTAAHVRDDLGNDVDFVLDGGPCSVGLESTIVNLSSDSPAILRPGAVTQEEIESLLGCHVPVRQATDIRVSGSLASHYSPQAEVRLLPAADISQEAEVLMKRGVRVVILNANPHDLYADMREADRQGAEVILTSLPAAKGIGLAVSDRLQRAATKSK